MLQADATPAVYVLEQSFAESGRTLRRFGLLARFRAEDPERRVILPHEHTRAAAKEDRWRVLLATKANFSPIFLMFPDPAAAFADARARGDRPAGRSRSTPTTAASATGCGASRSRGLVGRFQALLGGVKSYIADGHHRHATALRYRDAVGPDGAWTLGYFTPIEASGARSCSRTTGSCPRGRRSTRRRSACRAGSGSRGSRTSPRRSSAVAASPAPYAFALAEPGKGALVVEAEPGSERLLSPEAPACLRALDTYFLHHAVLGPLLGVPDAAVSYVHSQAEAEEALAKGACRLAVLMRATPVRADRGRGRRGGVDAGQEHVLPPEAPLGPRHPPARRLTETAMSLPLPPFFDPAAASRVYRVPYQERAAEARAWAAAHGIRPAVEDTRRTALLLIDVQNTFCLPEFELFVGGRSGRGAIEDCERIAAFLYRNLDRITQVVVTLDTHTAAQIFHPLFWVGPDGAHPAPHTVITLADVEGGRWRVNPALAAGRRPPRGLRRRGLGRGTTRAASPRAASTRSSSGPTTRWWAGSATRWSRPWRRPSSSTRSPGSRRRGWRSRGGTP